MSTSAIMISSGNGPGECQQATAHVLERIEREALEAGLDCDVSISPGRSGPVSAIVVLTGSGATTLVNRWQGVILWRCASDLRPKHKRKNWFVEVFALSAPQAGFQIDPAAIEMQAIRAGGPGGQHQNKTSSAIRARWTSPDGADYAVVVRDHRSQHQNRREAVARLEALAAQDAQERLAAGKSEERALHHQLQRGGASRMFEGPRFKEKRI